MIKEREKLEHHPSLLLLPSDVETVLLGATMRAREWKEDIFEESKQHQQRRERERERELILLQILPRSALLD